MNQVTKRKMKINNPLIYVVLFLASCLAFPPLIVIGFFYPMFKYLVMPLMRLERPTYSLKKHFFPIFKVFALILDQTANAIAGGLLNDCLLKREVDGTYHKKAYKYGKPYDTISEVTGINEEREALNKFGIWFTKALGVVLNDNHSILAINRDRNYPPHTKT